MRVDVAPSGLGGVFVPVPRGLAPTAKRRRPFRAGDSRLSLYRRTEPLVRNRESEPPTHLAAGRSRRIIGGRSGLALTWPIGQSGGEGKPARECLEQTMELHSLIGRFREIPYARDGGPEVPGEGPSIWATEAEEYLGSHEYLKRYPDYVEFLRHYGGAAIFGPSPWLPPSDTFFLIYGFGEFDDDADPLTQDGLFAFAFEQFSWRKPGRGRRTDACMLYQGFTFNATGDRADGVYALRGHEKEVEYTPRWPTFTAWLGEMVEAKGRWLPPEGPWATAGADKSDGPSP
jgi:hypothetical protein